MNRLAVLIVAGALCCQSSAADRLMSSRPNILWISVEDTSPWLGFCGESYAHTPNLDALARRGIYYTHAFATAPVCSPSRFAIITGRYATRYGTQGLRSTFPIPDHLHGFPTDLRRAGYYCTNNEKTDYNTAAEPRLIKESWDECGRQAHYRHRKPGQPFFAVFNLVDTHQSRVFEHVPEPSLQPAERHDPVRAPIPPYYPDTPTARRVMARVHDCITSMDRRVGEILAELEREGLAESTIVFFWSDHGQGIPRGKRTLWDSGLRVPLLVAFPKAYQHLAPAPPGSRCDRIVSLMDLGPTVLSLAGVPVHPELDGRPFLGPAAAPPRTWLVGARDRVDEAMEVSRSVRDARFLYIRNFMPHLSWNQPETFSDQLDLRREITRLAAEGRLNEAQLTYAAPRKPVEELYDTERDPWQVRNLASDPAYANELARLRAMLRAWQLETGDLGLVPESEAWRRVRASGRPLVELAARGELAVERIVDTAWRVGHADEVGELRRRLSDPDPAVRYWALVGLRVAGMHPDNVRSFLGDESPAVRIEAAALVGALEVLLAELRSDNEYAQVQAARELELMGPRTQPVLAELESALSNLRTSYARWAIEHAIHHARSGQSGGAAIP